MKKEKKNILIFMVDGEPVFQQQGLHNGEEVAGEQRESLQFMEGEVGHELVELV